MAVFGIWDSEVKLPQSQHTCRAKIPYVTRREAVAAIKRWVHTGGGLSVYACAFPGADGGQHFHIGTKPDAKQIRRRRREERTEW